MNPATPSRSTGFYAPELDSLRCLAVAGVMIAHFSPTLARVAPWGNLGVRLFFVLSGMLITLVLLRSRDRIAAGGSTRAALRHFFVRRIFRLWPLYFASLGLAYALKVAGTESGILWHLGFATNYYVYLHHDWPELLSHYWTLAVEQQYYIVWPFALLLLPRRLLPGLLICTLVAGPASRAWLALRAAAAPEFDHVLLSSNLDFFALGAAVAWFQHLGRLGSVLPPARLRAILLGSGCWIGLGSWLLYHEALPVHFVIYDGLIQGVGFAALIAYLLRQPESAAARLLRLPTLIYLGQISYGIYIFHNFMHRLGPSLLRRTLGMNYFASETAHVVYLSALSILVAAVSYHLFEAPVRRLGQRLA
jgi:peptidoglycan/LPS O-acetylase OafA/YrhL